MSGVNVTTLRQHLPEYLARVAQGRAVARDVTRAGDRGNLSPYGTPDVADAARGRLKGSLLRYDQPFDPVLPAGDWNMNR